MYARYARSRFLAWPLDTRESTLDCPPGSTVGGSAVLCKSLRIKFSSGGAVSPSGRFSAPSKSHSTDSSLRAGARPANKCEPLVPPPIGPRLGYILLSLHQLVPASGISSSPSSDWSPPRVYPLVPPPIGPRE
eukprot:1194386-Prorocentrum_minimum.AAC.5